MDRDEQDSALYESVQSLGCDWTAIAARMTDRTPRQCADRWRRFGQLIELEKQGRVIRDKRRRIGVFSTAPGDEDCSAGASVSASRGGINKADYELMLRLAASAALASQSKLA